MNPVVAVITPTKNRLKLLCETMDSVQQQSFDAWEHIVVDDGTCQEVSRSASDSRIRYMRRTGDKSGANVCRNIGIAESSAEFIVFLDSDDLLRPQCLKDRVDGTSGMPWSLRERKRPQRFELPDAHAVNRAIVRVDVHESRGAREVRDLVMTVRKIAQYYQASKESTVRVDAADPVSTTV